MKIIPDDKICNSKKLTPNKEYEVLEIDDDMPLYPDLYFKIKNDNNQEIWVDDLDCTEIPRIDRPKYLGYDY